ncbi:MAG: hypothetical protein IJX84_11315 [Clostridia bacterium]|nr:hypothetical protein [Clostridia bacterium]
MDKNLNARLPDGTMFDFWEKDHQRRPRGCARHPGALCAHRPMPAQAAGAVYGYLQGVEKNKLLLACNRRFPKGIAKERLPCGELPKAKR